MTYRSEAGVVYNQTFDAENHLVSVTVTGVGTTQYLYDGDGKLVKTVRPDSSATVLLGLVEYDLTAGGAVAASRSLYSVPGARVVRTGGSVYYVLTDHLGSASVTLSDVGVVRGEMRYYAYGATRVTSGDMTTDRLFTGQQFRAEIGLYNYGARWYDPYLNRWTQPDTIVPSGGNPQALNRYSYTAGEPLKYNDMSGHMPTCGSEGGCNATTRKYVPKNPWLIVVPPGVDPDIWIDMHLPSSETAFLSRAASPLHGNYNYSGYAGCNTYTQNCADGYHPAVDSRNIWGNPSKGTRSEIVNWTGRPIYSTAYGVVVSVGSSDWGNYVLIEHDVYGEKFYSTYAHLDSTNVAIGDVVDNNIIIGAMGSTLDNGGITEVHLHFEVRKATNVDLSRSDPFSGEIWWPKTRRELDSNFVDLGKSRFANYSSEHTSMP